MNETFDAVGGFTHHSTMAQMPRGARAAVIVVNGGHEQGRECDIRDELDRLDWALVIVIGDEESKFQTRVLHGPNRKIWQQNPTPGKHLFDRALICGYPSNTQKYLALHDRTANVRPLNWFFAGQATHARRYACIRALNMIPGGHLVATKHFFAQDLTQADYYGTMVRCKIVPCPGGPCTPDTFRLAEALEAGCVPIVDDLPGLAPGYPAGYWENVFGEVPPFPVIRNWQTLGEVMQAELAKWPVNRDEIFAWWQKYRSRMHDWLRDDIQELQRRAWHVSQ